MPDELGEVEYDPALQTWRRRLKRDPGKTEIRRGAEGLADAAKRAKDKAARPEPMPEKKETPASEPDNDSDDALKTEEDYKAKYGGLVGASKWRKSGKKTSAILESLGGPRA